MDRMIDELSDADALRILNTIAQMRLRTGAAEVDWTDDAREALQVASGMTPDDVTAGEGELARETLRVLAQDEEFRPGIQGLIEGPQPARLGVVATVATVTAVLAVLQSYVEIKRDKDGKWSFHFKKEPTEDSILAPLVKKLLSWLPGG